MRNRREILTSAVRVLPLAALAPSVRAAANPWSDAEIIQPADLAKRVQAGTAPPIFCVAFPPLYRQRHIKGAKYAGPGNKPEGIKSLETAVAALSKDAEVVLYCGCCPMDVCPNIRPSYETLKHLGFKKIRVLSVPVNMHTDWSSKGYPTESSVPPAA